MKSKLSRILVAVVFIAMIAGGIFYLREEAERGQAGEAELPTALAKHLEKLKEAVPETEEGPGSGDRRVDSRGGFLLIV